MCSRVTVLAAQVDGAASLPEVAVAQDPAAEQVKAAGEVAGRTPYIPEVAEQVVRAECPPVPMAEAAGAATTEEAAEPMQVRAEDRVTCPARGFLFFIAMDVCLGVAL